MSQSEHLRRVRLERGDTIEQVAFRAGLSVRTITRVERDGHAATERTLRKLAKAYDLDPFDLLPEPTTASAS